jgi:hypothetical protein
MAMSVPGRIFCDTRIPKKSQLELIYFEGGKK